MNDLLDDLVIRILGFLSSSDIHRTLAINKRFQGFSEHMYLWKNLCHRGASTKSLIRSLLAHNAGTTTKECEQYRMISRQLEAVSKLEKLRWKPAELSATNRLEKMEAHSMTLILDRFAVIIDGWGQSELNDVSIIDCCTLPVLSTIRVETVNQPRFRYGFSTTYYRGRLLVFGGCSNGGYSGDINDLYVVELTFLGRDEQVFLSFSRDETIPSDSCWDRDHSSILSTPPDGFKCVEAVYSSNKTPVVARRANKNSTNDHVPTNRGYHTAVVVHLDGRDQLLVWGGLHARRPTGRLELLDLTHTLEKDHEQSPWTVGQYSGMEPSPRFGHSCILLRSDDTCSDVYESCSGKPCPRPAVTVDRLVFIGGSDGNDLIRNGRELREIHVLHIVRRSPSQSLKGQSDELVWSRPACTTLLHANVFPGRCHCSALVGNRIILFGGGAHHSNATSILDVCTKKSDAFLASSSSPFTSQGADLAGIFSLDEHTLRRVDDSHSGSNRPMKRCSAASVFVGGKYFMIMGGFNSQRSQLGDVWLLDVSYETSDGFRADAASAALRAQQSSSTSLSLVGSEGNQLDPEDASSDAAQAGGTLAFSFQDIIHMAQLGTIDWSSTTTFYDLINMLNDGNDEDSGDDDEEEGDNMDDDEDYDEDSDDDEDYHDVDEQDDDDNEEEEDDGIELEENETDGGEL